MNAVVLLFLWCIKASWNLSNKNLHFEAWKSVPSLSNNTSWSKRSETQHAVMQSCKLSIPNLKHGVKLSTHSISHKYKSHHITHRPTQARFSFWGSDPRTSQVRPYMLNAQRGNLTKWLKKFAGVQWTNKCTDIHMLNDLMFHLVVESAQTLPTLSLVKYLMWRLSGIGHCSKSNACASK